MIYGNENETYCENCNKTMTPTEGVVCISEKPFAGVYCSVRCMNYKKAEYRFNKLRAENYANIIRRKTNATV